MKALDLDVEIDGLREVCNMVKCNWDSKGIEKFISASVTNMWGPRYLPYGSTLGESHGIPWDFPRHAMGHVPWISIETGFTT